MRLVDPAAQRLQRAQVDEELGFRQAVAALRVEHHAETLERFIDWRRTEDERERETQLRLPAHDPVACPLGLVARTEEQLAARSHSRWFSR